MNLLFFYKTNQEYNEWFVFINDCQKENFLI